jgi:hypothetical protein
MQISIVEPLQRMVREMAEALVYCVVGVRRACAYLRARARRVNDIRNLRYH